MFTKQYAGFRPNLLDIDKSGVYFVRKNIVDESYEENGNKVIKFSYDEAQMTAEEYSQYKLVEKNAGDIEYIAMMTGVDLED